MGHSYSSSTWGAKTGGLLLVLGQTGLHIEFKARLEYIAKPCLKNKKQKRMFIAKFFTIAPKVGKKREVLHHGYFQCSTHMEY